MRCEIADLPTWADRYSYRISDDLLIRHRPTVQACGYMTMEQLRDLANWKAPRSARWIEGNAAAYVEEITHMALCARTERARIEVLTSLDGVGWPTASVILHFFHADPYPIIDFRALWTLRMEVPTRYNFEHWNTYVDRCRTIGKQADLDMRTLDKALWQFSKENQPANSQSGAPAHE